MPFRLALLFVAAVLSVVNAAVLSVEPAAQTVEAGVPFQVDLVVSGLNPNLPPSVGAFEAELEYDPNIVSFSGASFGPFLGIPGVESLTDVAPLASSVNVAQVSFLPGAFLDANHPDVYSLVTLTFVGIGLGQSNLILTKVTLDDPEGLKIASTKTDGSVTVTPEPSVGHLLGLGGIVILIARIRQRARTHGESGEEPKP